MQVAHGYLHMEKLLQNFLLNKFFANVHFVESVFVFDSGTVTREDI